MKVQAFIAVATLALEGVIGHPTIHHSHHHKLHLRDLLTRDVDYKKATEGLDWNTVLKDKDWSEVFGGKKKAEGKGDTVVTEQKQAESHAESHAESTDSKESKKPTQKSSSGSGKCLNLVKLEKRATVQQDTYKGNTQGNIIAEADCTSSGDYSLTFTNNRGTKKGYILWNKIGADGQMNGMMTAPAKSFDLEDGQSATFTFGPNSQVGFAEDCGRATANGNVPNCNVGEANFNDQNTQGGAVGGSFYDVSMVTYNDIKHAGGSPVQVPMTLSADGYDKSTCDNCVYVDSSQNSPSQTCALGPNDASPFHVKAVFG